MSNALEVCKLNKSYDMFSLKDISFKVPCGCIMGFIGSNGSGKTTTIKSILEVIKYKGKINIFGLDMKNNSEQINENIGVVMDTSFYERNWKVSEVEYVLSPFYIHWNSKIFNETLKKFKIDKNKKVLELSRGMNVKLMLAVALSHEAKLLILDEPTSGLDPVARDEVCDIFRKFVSDGYNSILFSTHITSDLEKMAKYITFILNGRIVFTGVKEDLLNKFLLVKGKVNTIDLMQKKLLVGLREYNAEFEGMVDITNINKFAKDVVIKPITIEEIMIFMNREEYANE